MGKFFDKLDARHLELAKKRAARLTPDQSQKLPQEVLDKVSAAGEEPIRELHVGWCPRCGGALYLSPEDGGLFYFCLDCYFNYFDDDPWGDYDY